MSARHAILTPVRSASVLLAQALLAPALLISAVPAGAQERTPEAAVPIAAPAPDAVEGTWLGTLTLPGAELRVVVHLEAGEDGALSATMDSPDQGARGIPVREATFRDGRLTLDIAAVGASYEGVLDGRGRLVGEFSQGGADLPLTLERVEAVEGPPRPQEPTPPFPYRSEDVRYPVPEAGIELAGTLTLPQGDGPFPAVALVTGSGAQNRDSEVFGHKLFLVLADHLTRRGIAVLRSDDRGVGESEGVFAEATSRDFADDAAAAAAYLRARPEIDPAAIGLVGMSEGGLIAPMVAAEMAPADAEAADSDRLAFIVLLAAPGLPGEEILYLQGALISRAMGADEEAIESSRRTQERLFRVIREEEDPEARAERLEAVLREIVDETPEAERAARGIPPGAEEQWIESQVRAVRGPWFRYFLLHDPRPVLRRVTVPVLAIGGELDLQVPPAENLPVIEEALREAGNPDVTIVELPGLNHLFQPATTGAPAEYARIERTFSPEAMELVADWILERFPTPERVYPTR